MSDLELLERERGNKEYIETEITKSCIQNHITESRTASNEMCTFLVMNISSLQLIPNVIYLSRFLKKIEICFFLPPTKKYFKKT